MKADLFRYVVVHGEGGIYSDADASCVITPDFLLRGDKELVVTVEPQVYRSDYLCQWVFAAPKGS